MDTKYFIAAMQEWSRLNNNSILMYSEMTSAQRSEVLQIAQQLKEQAQ
jgi:hypothetical protein